jgi:hypothetical protein
MPRQEEPDPQSIAGKLYADRETNVLHASDVLRPPMQLHPIAPSSAPPPIPLQSPAPLPRPALAQAPIAPQVVAPAFDPPAIQAPPRAPAMPQMPSLPAPPARNPELSHPEPVIETPRDFQAAPIKLAPKPSAHVEAKHPAKPIEPDDHGQPVPLASFVADLTALPIRCPNHERIEIAVDREGRMHLLGRETAMRDLHVVDAWTKSHRELIAMACPQHCINHAHKTVLHVFTPEPASLADLHGSGLRLHVLAPVSVSGQTAWYAAALNK